MFVCLFSRDFACLSSCSCGCLELVPALLPKAFIESTSSLARISSHTRLRSTPHLNEFFFLSSEPLPRVDLTSMSLRTFTVFQDAVSSDAPQPKINRPNAMVTRSSSLNLTTSFTNATVPLNDLVALDKENFHPVTGERAGPPNNSGSKKRKTSVLSTKVQLSSTKKDAQPEVKKRKASTSTTKGKVKRDGKSTVPARRGAAKRTVSRKVSPMPILNEEEEVSKSRITQADIDSRCYELTVQPLADISQAYEKSAVFEGIPTLTCESKPKFTAAKVRFDAIYSN